MSEEIVLPDGEAFFASGRAGAGGNLESGHSAAGSGRLA